jgi:hypothetical protein
VKFDLDLALLAQDVHATAVEKGWWEGGERDLDDQFNNYVAEIMEAWEEYRSNRLPTDIYYNEPGNKPEGIPIELADLLIRILDSCENYGYDLAGKVAETYMGLKADTFAGNIRELWQLVGAASDCLHVLPGFGHGLERVVAYLLLMCEHHSIDLAKAVRIKVAFNETRSYRHGGKKA